MYIYIYTHVCAYIYIYIYIHNGSPTGARSDEAEQRRMYSARLKGYEYELLVTDC